MNTEIDQLPNASLLRILELTQKLSSRFSLAQMLVEVLQAGLDVLHADSGSVWLYNAEHDTIEMRFPVIEPFIIVAAEEGLVGECLAKNEVINVEDCYSDPRFNREVDKKTGYKTRSILSVPLLGLNKSPVGVLQLLNKKTGPFNQLDESLALALAAQSAVALQRTGMIEALIAKERLDEEVAIAKEIQLSTLPDEMPRVTGYDFGSGFIPAENTGGDLFDLVSIGDEVFILLGDATGHGLGPALSATQMQAMFRVSFRVGANLDQAYIHVNNQLVEDLPDNKFLTAFIGFLNPREHKVRYHSGGQGPILHYKALDKSFEWFPPTSFPVGVMEFETIDPPAEIQLARGDILAVISDGVYEYENELNEPFGQDRVADVFLSCDGSSMDELKDRLLEEVFAFGGNAVQLDDITIVLVARNSDQRDQDESLLLKCDRALSEIERIVDATERFLTKHSIGKEIRLVIDLVVEELFVNMVKYNTGTDSQIEIEMLTVPERIKVSLTDFNVERFDPTEHGVVDVNLPVEERTPGGLGIFLTLKMVDSIDYDYRNRTSKITFIKNTERHQNV